jgi:hypothetical protein
MANEKEKHGWITVAVIVGILGVLVYLLRGKLPMGYGAQKQPDRIEGNTASFDDIFPMSMGEHFVHPDELPNPRNLPVRYPPRAGHEISTLIEHGYAALWQPRNGLNTWMECPPSEVG